MPRFLRALAWSCVASSNHDNKDDDDDEDEYGEC